MESIRAVEQRLVDMKSERDSYKSKLESAATRVDILEKEIYDTQSRNKALEDATNPDNYSRVEDELNKANEKILEMTQLHTNLESDLNELQSRYKKTREEYSLIQNEWQTCDTALQSLIEEKNSLQAAYDELAKNTTNSAIESDLEEIKQERDYLAAELDSANIEIESLKASKSNEEELSSLKEERNLLTAELENYVESMEASQKKVQHFEDEMSTLKKERDDLHLELDQASQQIQELTDALIEAENITKHDDDNSNKSEEILSLKEDIETIKSSLDSASKHIAELQASLDSTIEERDDLHYQISTLKKDVVTRDESIAQLRLEISAQTVATGDAEKDQLLAEMNTLQETNWELETRMNAAEADAKNLREQLSNYDKSSACEQELIMRAAESEMNILRKKLQEVENCFSSTKDDVASLSAKCNKYEAEMLEKEDTIAQVENELYKLQSHAKAADNDSLDIEKLKEELEAKDKRIAHLETCKLTKEQMEKIKLLKEERKKFQEDSKIMKKQLHALKKAYDDLKASGTSGASNDVSAVRDLADARVQLAEVTSQLETAQSVSKSLKDKLRECAKQLQEYETERAGVIAVLERHGIDTIGLVAHDTSLTEGDTVIEEELADGVSKLAQKLIASQNNNQLAVASKNKIRQLEESINQMTLEVDEAKSTRSVLEKRLETLKSANRSMKEDLTVLTAERDNLALHVTELESSLKSAEGKIVSTSDTVSSEVQALEEENIELMRENKEVPHHYQQIF
jgi:chromosome segregation ATPase